VKAGFITLAEELYAVCFPSFRKYAKRVREVSARNVRKVGRTSYG
jgi:hypothetical protein